jgi:hypothetical protein
MLPRNERIERKTHLPLRWYRKGLAGLQVLVILVCRLEERSRPSSSAADLPPQ